MKGAKTKGSRRKARELALSALYMLDVQSAKDKCDGEAEIIERFFADRAPQEKVLEYARRLVRGVREKSSLIDGHIEEASEHWKLSRIAKVDRNILRIAAFEILFEEDTPHQVCINEAVEIAKKYGSEESSAFINGVLDRIRRGKP